MEKNPPSIILQNQDATGGVDEDSEILISDIESDKMELTNILEKEGVNLPDMVEEWKKNEMEHIWEEEVRRVNEILIAKQRAKIEMQSKNLGIAKGMGLRTKSLLQTATSSKQRKKRGHRTNNEAL